MNTSTLLITSVIMLGGMVGTSQGARILGLFQFPGSSHFVMFEPLMKELAARGHDVVVLSHFPQKTPLPNYTDISIRGSFNRSGFSTDFAANFGVYNMLHFFWIHNFEICKSAYEHPNVQKLIKSEEKFDLVITEIFGVDCFIGFAHKFRAPLISMISSMLRPWANERMGNPDNPSYIPNYFLPYNGKMSFPQRLLNTVYTEGMKWGCYYFADIPTQELSKRHLGDDLPELSEIARNTSIVFVSSHFSLSSPRPLVPGIVEVGGLHIGTPGKLPQNLEKFMNEARHGVIYFSLGSMVRGESLPEDKLQAFIQVFSELPQRVIWKADNISGLPDNILTSTWLPQLEILSHPNVRVFITHGGGMGTQEAIYTGVPMLGIPLYSDQKLNIENCVARGISVKLDYHSITKANLLEAIRTILDDQSYQKNSRHLSELYRDRPHSALQTAVFWTEYVIRHKGAPHLRSAAVNLPVYQYLLLDVVAVLLLATSVIFYILYFCIKKICIRLYRKNVSSTHEKGRLNKSKIN